MTDEFARRQMTKEQKRRFNEVSDDAYRKMKDKQDQTNADLEKAAEHREKYPEMVIPPDEAIKEMNKDFDMTQSQMADRADEISRAVVTREAKEAERAKQPDKDEGEEKGGFLSKMREKRGQKRDRGR